MPVKKLTFEVSFFIEKDDGEYHAFCPSLKGLHTSGRTRREALENAVCAAEAYIESLMTHREPIPLYCHHEEIPDPATRPRSSMSLIEVTV